MLTMAHSPVLQKLKDRTRNLVATTTPERCPGDFAVLGLVLWTWLFFEGGNVLYAPTRRLSHWPHVAVERLCEVLKV